MIGESILAIALIIAYVYLCCGVCRFIIEIPKQLKRIADALERRKDG